MVPYEWVRIMGPCLLSSNLHPFHDELVERVQIPFFSPLLFSILIDLVRCGLPFACLVFIDLLIPFLRSPSYAVASGSKEAESRVPLFWFYRA